MGPMDPTTRGGFFKGHSDTNYSPLTSGSPLTSCQERLLSAKVKHSAATFGIFLLCVCVCVWMSVCQEKKSLLISV